jgi:hypothetical protein
LSPEFILFVAGCSGVRVRHGLTHRKMRLHQS